MRTNIVTPGRLPLRVCLLSMLLLAMPCCQAAPNDIDFSAIEPPDKQLPADLVISNISIDEETELSRYKKQALQSASVSNGSLSDLGENGLSTRFLETSIGSGIPLGSFDNIIGLTPRFRVDWVDGPSDIDIPSELFQFELQIFYRRPIRDRLSAMVIASPAMRSDLTTSRNALRIFALGLLNWECIPDCLTLSGGVVSLGRADLPVLPAMGLTWTPDRFTKLDLRFPTSQLSYRLHKDGTRSETWAFCSGGIGGNTWAVTRQPHQHDELSLGDVRVTVGIDKVLDGGGGGFAEFGYAFNRHLEYESDLSEIELPHGILAQLGWRY